jgi:hypothetical protein
MKAALSSLFITLLLATPASAILDTNGNDMSDIWERQYNNGELFPPTFLPNGDADGDGQTNVQEATAGTDPLTFDPPEGHFVQSIRHIPATWYQDPEEEEPVLITPEAFEVEWHGVPGKQYNLFFSTDLESGNWHPVGHAINGYGWPITVGCLPSCEEGQLPPKIFWRVAVHDIDNDGDGLTDYDEFLLGTSRWDAETFTGIPDLWLAGYYISLQGFDPDADDDNDGLTNFEEYLHSSNPKLADTDGDGTSDFDEVAQGSNPNDASDDGAAPSDLLEEIEFKVGGDYASWRMEIQAKGPRDQRLLRLASQSPGDTETRTFKLQRNNRYEITLHRTGGYEDWYCWEAAVDDKPGIPTFQEVADWQLSNRNEDSHFFTIAGHWLADNRLGLLTSHLHSYQNDVASPLKAELVPVAIEDNILATGVDIVSNSVASDVAGYQDKLWIMAPIAGAPPPADYSNLMKFNIPLSPPAELQMESEKAAPDPDTISLADTKPEVLWRGTGDNESSDNSPVFKIGEHEDDVELPIGVKTMKHRNVKVIVHHVTGAKRDPATGDFINLKPPVTQITAQQIKDKLYEIYSRQINAWFDEHEVVPHTIDWDIGVTSDWGSPEYPITGNALESYNRVFDKGGNADDEIENPILRPEETKLLSLIDPQSNANIHVFLIGGCWAIQTHTGVGNVFLPDDDFAVGTADEERRVVYIASEKINGGALVVQEYLTTIAHEIGHIIIGDGHPDQGGGPAPLSGTSHLERLMFSNIDQKATANALDKNLLVKAEWDVAETWLQAEEVAGRMSP